LPSSNKALSVFPPARPRLANALSLFGKETAMRAYGVKRNDRGCCPGHDKFPSETYRSRRSKRSRAEARRIAHKRARAWARVEILMLQR
jgi:hypothetical protein